MSSSRSSLTDAGRAPALAIPLARWADRQLAALARETGSARIAALTGQTLLGMRGSANGYRINGRISAGNGGSHLMPAADDGWFALTLLRAEDRDLLGALFADEALIGADWPQIEAAALRFPIDELVERGRLLGLPCASADETPASAPVKVQSTGPHRQRPSGHRLLVVDLSAIWAGPLAGHLLWLAGAEVVKVESPTRPDLIRRDDPATFGLINQGKDSALIDLARADHKAALIALIRRADVVIESSRPRALRHLGIDADALVREVPGLVWLTVTGHGASGEPANWTGVGNDCGVAAGLTRAMEQAGGGIGYVGDAVTDPLTGITAAQQAVRALASGSAKRIGLSMSAIGAQALAEERAADPSRLAEELCNWGKADGGLFPSVPSRRMLAPLHDLGADTARWFPGLTPC